MRLLDAKTLEVVEFMDHNVPKYVILSHTWITGQEVTLQDMHNKKGMERSGYEKIRQACALALKNGYGYAWVDTCCIDKTSSAELSEAINSMMSWYERSEICYTYLADVPPDTNIREPKSSFATSRWFERGWTLQELIAPSRLIFLYDDWSVMYERDDMVDLITQITGIDDSFLFSLRSLTDGSLQSRLHTASIAEKMSWASKRKTTRIEDTAYCLLGIFGINMPLLYGEGTHAFLRLQEEIMKRSDDQTLLAWYLLEDDPDESGVLATSPAAFSKCRDFIPCNVGMPTPPFQMTNKGLHIEMPVSSESFRKGRYGLLQCRMRQDPTTRIAIPLESRRNGNGLYVRSKKPLLFLSHRYWRTWSFTPVNLLPSQQSYDIGSIRQYDFGNPQSLFYLTEEGVLVDKERSLMDVYEPDLIRLHDEWTNTLQRLFYHAKNSVCAVLRSLALSPWMFTFVVDSLISRAFEPLGSMIDHADKHFRIITLGGSVALHLGVYFFSARWRRLQRWIGAISSPEAFLSFGTNFSALVLVYFCCKLLPPELLRAILENKRKELGSVLLGLALRFVVTKKGAGVTTIAA
ncbi:hypothetical protein LB505_012975 [Fusarium chuoi]|nr:hypothetical protein LB505_012975 [Fusarium chuoi]